MRWVKKGQIFNVSGEYGWMNSHAQKPAVLVKEDRLRIYFSTRPEVAYSKPTFIDVALDDPGKILYVHDKPILEPGGKGTFDAHGITPSCVVKRSEKNIWLYYGGWDRRVSIPHSDWTGLAMSRDGGTTFLKVYEGPVLDRTPLEIYSGAGCYVLQVMGTWYMWYGSGQGWQEIDGQLEEQYSLRRAHSYDGVKWHRESLPIFAPTKDEANTCPSVLLREHDWYDMWFSYRKISQFRAGGPGSYRIGHAWSHDIEHWTRDSDLGLSASEEGWDSEMVAYPCVVKTATDVLMFYNGNGFGASGIGYARLEK